MKERNKDIRKSKVIWEDLKGKDLINSMKHKELSLPIPQKIDAIDKDGVYVGAWITKEFMTYFIISPKNRKPIIGARYQHSSASLVRFIGVVSCIHKYGESAKIYTSDKFMLNWVADRKFNSSFKNTDAYKKAVDACFWLREKRPNCPRILWYNQDVFGKIRMNKNGVLNC